ncbi:MAG: hypothetical protein F6K40_01540 [Okeania sp. SIO3I5]|uniref:hypothetical protein n=1 Tax=Okeania sp. SIO3I5 TaxID=2607805 RepID=UPI0013BBACD2|nr:hypothetical protein [Okeania sp. SIO3I5]NEQ35061.1 hypothetical protein [Okeania sp. SIO3I5]
MAEVEYGEGFEFCGRLEEVVATFVLFDWQGFGGFCLDRVLQFFQFSCYFDYGHRKCTLKIKDGMGSTTLLLKLTKIPIRD